MHGSTRDIKSFSIFSLTFINILLDNCFCVNFNEKDSIAYMIIWNIYAVLIYLLFFALNALYVNFKLNYIIYMLDIFIHCTHSNLNIIIHKRVLDLWFINWKCNFYYCHITIIYANKCIFHFEMIQLREQFLSMRVSFIFTSSEEANEKKK